MDANKMAKELELKLDRSSSFGSPGYEDFEISSVLTEAMELYILKFFKPKNNRLMEGFDTTEARNQGFSALIEYSIPTVSTSQAGTLENGFLYDLPTDFRWTIHEEVTTSKEGCDSVITDGEVYLVGYDEVSRLRNNKYKKPYVKNGRAKIWRLVYSREVDGSTSVATAKRHQLMTDGSFTISEYRINYIRYAPSITVDQDTPANQVNCILDESTHHTIVDIATSLMLERVKEQEIKNIESVKDLE